jgi:hypothetical protein
LFSAGFLSRRFLALRRFIRLLFLYIPQALLRAMPVAGSVRGGAGANIDPLGFGARGLAVAKMDNSTFISPFIDRGAHGGTWHNGQQ